MLGTAMWREQIEDINIFMRKNIQSLCSTLNQKKK